MPCYGRTLLEKKSLWTNQLLRLLRDRLIRYRHLPKLFAKVLLSTFLFLRLLKQEIRLRSFLSSDFGQTDCRGHQMKKKEFLMFSSSNHPASLPPRYWRDFRVLRSVWLKNPVRYNWNTLVSQEEIYTFYLQNRRLFANRDKSYFNLHILQREGSYR